jgi:hypothetical protein
MYGVPQCLTVPRCLTAGGSTIEQCAGTYSQCAMAGRSPCAESGYRAEKWIGLKWERMSLCFVPDAGLSLLL